VFFLICRRDNQRKRSV